MEHGKPERSPDFYCKSVSQKGFTEEEFLEVFDEDLPHLIDQGINKDDVPIMLDQFRYFLKNRILTNFGRISFYLRLLIACINQGVMYKII